MYVYFVNTTSSCSPLINFFHRLDSFHKEFYTKSVVYAWPSIFDVHANRQTFSSSSNSSPTRSSFSVDGLLQNDLERQSSGREIPPNLCQKISNMTKVFRCLLCRVKVNFILSPNLIKNLFYGLRQVFKRVIGFKRQPTILDKTP